MENSSYKSTFIQESRGTIESNRTIPNYKTEKLKCTEIASIILKNSYNQGFGV